MSKPTTSSTKSDTLKPKHVQMIKELCSLWRCHQANGIKIRHQIGKRLNKELGPPSQRQPYKATVVSQAAKELGVNITNVYRFRRFAEKFSTYKKFCKEHPDATSWTAARALITEPCKPVSSDRKTSALVRSLKSSVESLKSSKSCYAISKGCLMNENWRLL